MSGATVQLHDTLPECDKSAIQVDDGNFNSGYIWYDRGQRRCRPAFIGPGDFYQGPN